MNKRDFRLKLYRALEKMNTHSGEIALSALCKMNAKNNDLFIDFLLAGYNSESNEKVILKLASAGRLWMKACVENQKEDFDEFAFFLYHIIPIFSHSGWTVIEKELSSD